MHIFHYFFFHVIPIIHTLVYLIVYQRSSCPCICLPLVVYMCVYFTLAVLLSSWRFFSLVCSNKLFKDLLIFFLSYFYHQFPSLKNIFNIYIYVCIFSKIFLFHLCVSRVFIHFSILKIVAVKTSTVILVQLHDVPPFPLVYPVHFLLPLKN